MTMCDANDIIVPMQILYMYKESNNHVFVFVLTTCNMPHCLVQDTFDEFILEYI